MLHTYGPGGLHGLWHVERMAEADAGLVQVHPRTIL